MRSQSQDRTVLVAVLKSPRDLEILRREHWYRIPVSYLPKRRFGYLAFFEPAHRGKGKGRIRYYAKVKARYTRRREQLLPDETDHPRAEAAYRRLRVGRIQQLRPPIRNSAPRRVSFGFTTHHRLRSARDILELFAVAPTEQLMAEALKRAEIPAMAQHTVNIGHRRFRLDFALYCKRGAIAIECDNTRAHAGAKQRSLDVRKNAVLRRHRWTVVRLCEQEITTDMGCCLARVRVAVNRLGGVME